MFFNQSKTSIKTSFKSICIGRNISDIGQIEHFSNSWISPFYWLFSLKQLNVYVSFSFPWIVDPSIRILEKFNFETTSATFKTLPSPCTLKNSSPKIFIDIQRSWSTSAGIFKTRFSSTHSYYYLFHLRTWCTLCTSNLIFFFVLFFFQS